MILFLPNTQVFLSPQMHSLQLLWIMPVKKRTLLLQETVGPLDLQKIQEYYDTGWWHEIARIATEHEKKSATETHQSTRHNEQALSVRNAFLRNLKLKVLSVQWKTLKKTRKVYWCGKVYSPTGSSTALSPPTSCTLASQLCIRLELFMENWYDIGK